MRLLRLILVLALFGAAGVALAQTSAPPAATGKNPAPPNDATTTTTTTPTTPPAPTTNTVTPPAPTPTTTTPPGTNTTATTTPPPVPAPEFGLLRIYRHKRFSGSALSPTITIDGKPAARIGNGRRVTLRLPAGTHSVASDDKSSAIELNIKAGQEYFVRVDEEAGFWKGHGRLTVILPEQGAPEYKKSKPVESDRRLNLDVIDVAETEAGATGGD